jgi:hypothetical protein
MFNVKESYQKHAKAMNSQRVADPKVCTKVMKDMIKQDPALFDKVNELAEQTTFTVRKYGPGDFYCYPSHKDLKCQEPWPASRYPKASLCVQFALEIQNNS